MKTELTGEGECVVMDLYSSDGHKQASNGMNCCSVSSGCVDGQLFAKTFAVSTTSCLEYVNAVCHAATKWSQTSPLTGNLLYYLPLRIIEINVLLSLFSN